MTQIPDLPTSPPDDEWDDVRTVKGNERDPEYPLCNEMLNVFGDPFPYSSRRHSDADGPMHYIPRNEP